MVKVMLKVIKKVFCFAILNFVRKTFWSFLYNISTCHVITVYFANKGASIELLVEMNTNTLFSFENRFYLNYVFFINKKHFKTFVAIFQERSHLGVIQDLRSCG